MNSKQKIVVWIGLALIVLMGIYPPWVVRLHRTAAFMIERPIHNRGFIFDPPNAELADVAADLRWDEWDSSLSNTVLRMGLHLDSARLAVEWITVVLVVAGLLLCLTDKKAGSPVAFGVHEKADVAHEEDEPQSIKTEPKYPRLSPEQQRQAVQDLKRYLDANWLARVLEKLHFSGKRN